MQIMAFQLATSRLVLREFLSEDASGFFAMNNDPLVLQFTGDQPFTTIAAAEAFIRDYDHYQRYGFGRWSVIRQSDGAFLGFCGLKYHPNHDYIDLGFRLSREHWGQGYATEAALACLRYGWAELQLARVVGRVRQENLASINVLEKIGMRRIEDFDFEGHPGFLYEILQKA